MKLPIGSIRPNGWLRHQLELEAAGLTATSRKFPKWCNLKAMPGPLLMARRKRLGRAAVLAQRFRRPRLRAQGRAYHQGSSSMDRCSSSLARNPTAGSAPRSLKTSLQGKPDLWPHMVMLNVLQSFYEYSADPRVLPFNAKYHQWLNSQPGPEFRQRLLAKDSLRRQCRNRLLALQPHGEAWLLDLAKKIHRNMADWSSDVINWHNVNIAQGFREPGVFYEQSHDEKSLKAAERNYQKVMGLYGQFPGGGFGGDEKLPAPDNMIHARASRPAASSSSCTASRC